MPLQSVLLSRDAKLQSCLVSDAAHVTPGARGTHVARIQMALNQLSDAALTVDGAYGLATASAVMAYKNDPSRRILQPSQKTADNIVGKGTIASLDREMLLKERQPAGELRITVLRPRTGPVAQRPATERSAVTLAFKLPAIFADTLPNVIINPTLPSKSVSLRPREFSQLLIQNPGGNTIVHCINTPPARGDVTPKICWLWDPDLPQTDRLVPEPVGQGLEPNETNGNRFFLVRKGDKPLNADAFRPGDSTIIATNAAGQQVSIQVVVRAANPGPVARPPLTKLEPGSKFFSASRENGGEPDPLSVFSGRPVNPNRGGRLINLGGEQETPEFEDYQVSLGFSGYAKPHTNMKAVFRPVFDDPDPAVGIPPKSASHICIRGNPLTGEFINAIKTIGQPGCLFTFSGAPGDAQKAVKTLGGTVLEDKNIQSGDVVIRL